MAESIFVQIRADYAFLNRVERTIADFLLTHPREFITYSMAQLAEKAGVSQGSIHNFSKKFGGGGFAALKLQVAGCLPVQDEETFSVIDSTKGIKAAMELKIQENAAAFRNTLQINEEAALQRAVKRILAAKKIEIYGVFHSGIAAKDVCYQLIQLGIPAAFVSDMLMCAVSASMLDENGLVIAVSSSGRTKEIVDAVRIAKKNRAAVICLTCDRFSPLAQLADVVLLSASSGMSESDRNGEVRSAQLLVLDTLCSYIRSVIDAGDREHYERLREIISSHSIKD